MKATPTAVKGKRVRLQDTTASKAHVTTGEQQSPYQPETNVLQHDLQMLSSEKMQHSTLTDAQRLTKAIRHLHDALYIRSIRHDIDLPQKRLLKFVWSVQSSHLWNGFMFWVSFAYQILTFFEAPYTDAPQVAKNQWHTIVALEAAILALITIDLGMNLLLKNTNLKLLMNGVCWCLLIADYVQVLGMPSSTPYRFGRVFRVIVMITYSKDLRRTLMGILHSSKNLMLLFLLYALIISAFAYVGSSILPETPNTDSNVLDYTTFTTLFTDLFIMSTIDMFPDIMIPALQQSLYYLAFFVPFLLLFVFVFQPIPLAVVYEDFRKHRRAIAMEDLTKQRIALHAAFVTLDHNGQGYLTEDELKPLLNKLYTLSPTEQDTFIDQLNKDHNDQIQLEEWYQILEVISSNPLYSLQQPMSNPCWDSLRAYLNGLLRLDRCFKDDLFHYIMILVTLLNIVLIIIEIVLTDDSADPIFTILDNIFFAFFALEFIIKVIRLGLHCYFQDSWNIFDFVLLILQIIFDYVLLNIISSQAQRNLKTNRVIRLAKVQRAFRVLRVLRSIKVCAFMLRWLQIFSDVTQLLYKVSICIPVIWRLLVPIWQVFYIYAVIGVEVYSQANSEASPYALNSCPMDSITYDWSNCSYTNFNTLLGAYLSLLQIFVFSGWGWMVFDLSYSKGSLAGPTFYAGSFVLISIFLMALIGGLEWEVFQVVSNALEQEGKEDEEEQFIELSPKRFKRSTVNQNVVLFTNQIALVDVDQLLSQPVQPQPPKTAKLSQLQGETPEYEFNEFGEIHPTKDKSLLEYEALFVPIEESQAFTSVYLGQLIRQVKRDEFQVGRKLDLQNHRSIVNTAILKDQRCSLTSMQFKHESSIHFLLSAILKYRHTPTNQFFQMMHVVQQKIAMLLLPEGSTFRFIHHLNGKHWVTIAIQEQGSYQLIRLQNPLWNYIERICSNNQGVMSCSTSFELDGIRCGFLVLYRLDRETPHRFPNGNAITRTVTLLSTPAAIDEDLHAQYARDITMIISTYRNNWFEQHDLILNV